MRWVAMGAVPIALGCQVFLPPLEKDSSGSGGSSNVSSGGRSGSGAAGNTSGTPGTGGARNTGGATGNGGTGNTSSGGVPGSSGQGGLVLREGRITTLASPTNTGAAGVRVVGAELGPRAVACSDDGKLCVRGGLLPGR